MSDTIALSPLPRGIGDRILAPLGLSERESRMAEAAAELEASFLTEMLSAAGLGKTRSTFGGGTGEDQFSSFLVREQARAIVDSGGIGLSEMIFEALVEQADG